MRLTTKSRYGTRMMLDLAIYARERPVPLSDISRRQNISVKYLEKLIRKLKMAGFVSSHRGPFGGHMLAMSPEDITVGNLVRVLEDTTAIADCAESDDAVCGICNRAGDCLSRWVWVAASRAMFETLDSISLSSLINQSEGSALPSEGRT
ncbi:MAG: RrF2 family transcriptional regulator [Desulfobacterales bacterium]|nr:RrF2 family transcriptional regulator [Desulfobacterales bacterium]